MRLHIHYALFALVLMAGTAPGAYAADEADVVPGPLAPFERLIGGRWHLQDSHMELSWGPGHRSVTSRGYFTVAGEALLVSEGLWFWHPGENSVRGIFTAANMPVVLFEYETRFEQDSMISKLRSYSADGSAADYVERWEFVDDTHLEWTLLKQTPEGLVREMGGTYVRKP